MQPQSTVYNLQPTVPSAGNVLFCGDNLTILQRYVADDSVDLIYLDPPFNSRADYPLLGKGEDSAKLAFRDIWKWDEQAQRNYAAALQMGNERISRCLEAFCLMLGEGAMLAYLAMMTPRLGELQRVLKQDGSLYLHCNPAASHYLKLLLDAVFGAPHFQNELIWHYQTGGGSKRRFSRKHDVIFLYTKSSKWKFYPERIAIPRTAKALARAQRPAGARIAADDPTKNPHDVLYIQQMNPMARERSGYPTQKPEALLEALILASSDEGDVVLDACCGSGTTLAVAARLNRRWWGIDVAAQAIAMTRARLGEAQYTLVDEDAATYKLSSQRGFGGEMLTCDSA